MTVKLTSCVHDAVVRAGLMDALNFLDAKGGSEDARTALILIALDCANDLASNLETADFERVNESDLRKNDTVSVPFMTHKQGIDEFEKRGEQ
ncbi:hypothetical protein [Defluviimonas salinarum]|uniref:Uncharacterized protein n=1 Tax=Defluviimonas salinarum TaxID=2992147 RepID=A0ABT3IXW0_9RHOB|nr:hypothetical protein [Defluviimonas salinarum]MCW3780277.1 hypothetical protein [Defluviimonas salinarum]